VNVGINFRNIDYVSGMAAGVTAGAVVSQSNWNSTVNGPTNGVGTTLDIATPIADTLVDSTGAATPLTIAWNYDGTYANWDGTATGDQRLMNGYVDILYTNNDNTVTIGNIPAGYSYDVYAYFGANVNGRSGTIGIDGFDTYSYMTYIADHRYRIDVS
jgi:hypothetical protein